MLFAAALIAAHLFGAPAQDASEPAPATCETGPVERNYGGSPWLVYSCDNGGVVFVSAPTSAAGPSYFVWAPTAEGFQLAGETNSPDRAATDAAHAELLALTPADLETLTAETRAVAAPSSPR